MARKPMAEPKLKSFEEVNQHLAEMAELQRQIELEQSACNESVDQLKAVSQDKIKPLIDDMKTRELLIKEYCEHHRESFEKVKTKKLTHGSVGFRLSSSVSIPDPLYTIEQLRALGLNHCIRSKIDPDKDQIKQLDREQLNQIGASVKPKNTFGYELAKVNPAATAEA